MIKRCNHLPLGVLAVALCPGILLAQGFPNVARTPGELLAGPVAPEQGRTAIIAWHGERIVTVPEPPGSQPGADVLMRVVDINDPANPQVTIIPAGTGGFNSHGYFQSGTHLFVGPHCLGADLSGCNGSNNVYMDSFRIGGSGPTLGSSMLRRGDMEGDLGLSVGAYNRSGAQSPWGAEMWWSYGQVSGNAWLAIRRSPSEWVYDWANNGAPTGPAVQATWDHLGQTGVIGMPFIYGNILIYASDQTGSGVATYDISDPTNPVLLDVLKEENPGGYWPEVYSHYIFFPRRDSEGGTGSSAGYMVVDFSDPSNLSVVADRNVPGSNQYVTFQDEFAFMNNYKIDMRTFDVVLTLATNDTTLDASQFALPVGNLVVTGGYGSLGPGLAIWAHQAAPDTRGPFVAYHIPRPDQTNYSTVCPIVLSIPETLRTETIVNGTSLIVRPVGGSPVPIWHSFGQNKLLTVTPRTPLATNTTYEVVLTSAIVDAAGNGLEPYTFRFSTGSGLSGGNQPPVMGAIGNSPTIGTPGAPVTFTWSGSDPDDTALEYRFDPGDGSPRTAWGTSTSLQHSYAQAGHYQVTVQVRDTDGTIAARSRSVTVMTLPTEANSTASSTIVLNGAGDRAFAVNPDNDTVTAINATTLAKLWEAPTAADPRNVTAASDGTIWVTCHDADVVDVLDAASGNPLARLALGYGAAPIGITSTPDRSALLVACSGDGTLRRFSAATRTQNAMLAVGPSPRAIAVNHAGNRALITRFLSGEYEGQVYDVSLSGSMTLTRTISLRRNQGNDGSASSRGVPNYLAGIRISPDGDYAWVVGKKDNATRGTFTAPSFTLGSDNTVRAQLMVVDLATNAEDYDRRFDLDNSESPVAVTFSPLGDYAFIALQGNNLVAVVDVLDYLGNNSPGTIRTRWSTGLAPQGLAMNGASGLLLTNDFMSRQVTALSVNPFLSEGAAAVSSATVGTVAEERLPEEVLLGKQVFYNAGDPRMSAEGYMSCATCHVDGSHDGRTFDFTDRGEGFRNTTDLRGRSGLGHGLVHWSANFDEIQDFENDIRHGFGGNGFLSDTQFASLSATLGAPKAGASPELDSLAAYVTSLGSLTVPRSPHRDDNGALSAAAVRGEALFNSHSCASCHTVANDFTDRQMHDVGTLRASSGQRLAGPFTTVDTPTLLGLFDTAPYLHNGTAASLREVFTNAGGALIQAEGVPRTGSNETDIGWIPMKEWHQGGFASFHDPQSITFTVNSSTAGTGAIEFRYNSGYRNASITLTVNGTPTAVSMPQTPNEPGWWPNEWRTYRRSMTFAAGTNTIVVSGLGNGETLLVDDVLFSTPGDTPRASEHLRGFTAGQLDDIVAYLQSLDRTNTAKPAVSVERSGAIPPGSTDIASIGSGELTYVLRNSGSGPLNFGRFRLVSNPAGAITLTEQPAAHVLPGGTTTLRVQVTGAATATLSAWTDDPNLQPLTWTLETTGSPSSVGSLWTVF
jgi:cytochrome c551/c552